MNFNMDFSHSEAIKKALTGVVDSQQYIAGENLREFEKEWASFNGATHAIGVGSGTDAIILTLRALGVGPGDEVISPAFNAAYAAQAVTAVGATNVYADIDPQTMLLDVDKVSKVITPKTRAVIAVHLFGQMCDMNALRDLAHWHSIALIEDAAQAHGALSSGASPGRWSDAACYSHYPTKNLGCLGEGGSVVTRHTFIDQRIRLLRDAGRTDRYVHLLAGANSMLDEIQAAVLRVKLPHLSFQNGQRAGLAARYRKSLEGVGDIRFQHADGTATITVHHLFVIRTGRRWALHQYLRARLIPSLSHYPVPMIRQPFGVVETLEQGPFPHAERVAKEVLSLPLWPSMSDVEQDCVIGAVKDFYRYE